MSSPVNQKSFSAQYINLAEIATFIHSSCQEASFDNKACYSVETAVDEACSNIIEHAYLGNKDGVIDICCQVNQNGIEVTLIDHGQSFDPGIISEPDLTASIEDRDTHGLGLFFIRKLMDKVTFSRGNDQSNILILTKYKTP